MKQVVASVNTMLGWRSSVHTDFTHPPFSSSVMADSPVSC